MISYCVISQEPWRHLWLVLIPLYPMCHSVVSPFGMPFLYCTFLTTIAVSLPASLLFFHLQSILTRWSFPKILLSSYELSTEDPTRGLSACRSEHRFLFKLLHELVPASSAVYPSFSSTPVLSGSDCLLLSDTPASLLLLLSLNEILRILFALFGLH